MIWSWIRGRKRRELMTKPLPAEWKSFIEAEFVHWHWLKASEQERLAGLTHAFVEMKHWEGCQGLELTDPMKALIAAQAGLLLLGTPRDCFGNVKTVLVYPDRYVLPGDGVGCDGEIYGDRAVLGHASTRGPLVLSWPDVLAGARDAHDGRNLVFHEFAHKLDMLDGLIDGTPPLDCRRELKDWVEAMSPVYQKLQKDVEQNRRTFLTPYAATNVAEFFAVATEYFFERPEKLKSTHPKVYRSLAKFYGQDTAARAVQHRIGTRTRASKKGKPRKRRRR